MVDCVTDDRERTAAAVRDAFLRHGGCPGAAGSVAYLFKEVGRLLYGASAALGARLSVAWEAGAEDVVLVPDGSVEVLTDPVEIDAVRAKLAEAGAEPVAAAVLYRSSVRVELSAVQRAQMQELLRSLAKLGGVRSVYTNAENVGELLAGV